jgi:hypothetical protein
MKRTFIGFGAVSVVSLTSGCGVVRKVCLTLADDEKYIGRPAGREDPRAKLPST